MRPPSLSARRLLVAALVALAVLGTATAALGLGADEERRRVAPAFALERLATGLVRPTWVGTAPGDQGARGMVDKPGRVLRGHAARRAVLLDLRREVRLGAEQGLLGAAFHPDFARNRRLVLHFSDRRGDTRVVEVPVGRDGRAHPGRRRQLLFQRQPEENHNGGAVLFGPDGRLYLGLGDGGGAFDPRRTAQDLGSRLGKLLAADVDAPGRPRWRVVAYGLRNPWRFSFDPALGEVWVGDVGQDEREEIHRAYLEPDEPPKNFGWSAYDGSTPLEGRRLDETGELVWPVAA